MNIISFESKFSFEKHPNKCPFVEWILERGKHFWNCLFHSSSGWFNSMIKLQVIYYKLAVKVRHIDKLLTIQI